MSLTDSELHTMENFESHLATTAQTSLSARPGPGAMHVAAKGTGRQGHVSI
jgi:hypothetical protein